MKDCRKRVLVEETTCNQRQEPLILRSKAQCSPIGVDGRTNNLDSLVRVSIGWQIEESNYFEQIGLCVDEANYGTIWTKHTLHGQNIAHRDKHPDRPGFKVDTTRSERWEYKAIVLQHNIFFQVLLLVKHQQDESNLHEKKPETRCNNAAGWCD